MKTIVIGGGCFWCIEAVFQRVKGVEKVVSGYAGGDPDNKPEYRDLHTGKSTHAEVIQVTYSPDTVPLDTLLDIFFYVHDPTTKDRQGHDIGPEYRSIILCKKDEIEQVERAIERAQKLWKDPIVTEVNVLDAFFEAEAFHQDFYNQNQNNPYCQVIINPKIAKFEQKFSDYLKKQT